MIKTRKLKFRVFDGKRMIHPDYIQDDGRAYWQTECAMESTEDVMQFTGLRDRNGKEIYEEDIVSLWHEEMFFQGNVKGIMVWSDAGGWMIDFPENGCSLIVFNLDLEFDQIEIIGNIHENGDLLK